MEILLSIIIGVSLAAACGFRVFVPLLVMSIASLSGYLELSEGWLWIGTYPALISLGVATLLEVFGYYFPWIDNLLDVASAPLAAVAGVITTISVVHGLDPMLSWTLSAVAGGGLAGSISLITAKTRAASSAFTAGIANPAISTAEAVTSVSLSIAAIFIPFIAFILVAVVITVLIIRYIKKKKKKEVYK